MERWEKKVCVVTGASSGIGAAICRKLAESNITVIGLARRVELVETICEEVRKNNGSMYALKCDVSDVEDIQKVFKYIRVTFGPIQILINNAAYLKSGRIIEMSAEDLKQTLDTNLLGTTICAKEMIAQVREQDLEGHIINMNSIMGHSWISTPKPLFNLYPSTKYGIGILCRILQHEIRECKAKIKVSSVTPGLVGQTDIFNKADMTDFSDDVVNSLPHILPEDVASGIFYALSTPPNVQVGELILKGTEEFF